MIARLETRKCDLCSKKETSDSGQIWTIYPTQVQLAVIPSLLGTTSYQPPVLSSVDLCETCRDRIRESATAAVGEAVEALKEHKYPDYNTTFGEIIAPLIAAKTIDEFCNVFDARFLYALHGDLIASIPLSLRRRQFLRDLRAIIWNMKEAAK